MKRSVFFLALLSLAWVAPALALDLQSARSSGAVGEKLDGYVAAIQSSAEVNALVADVNAKRKQEYTRISKENGQPVDVVAKLAMPQIVVKLPAGAMYQGADGSWQKK